MMIKTKQGHFTFGDDLHGQDSQFSVRRRDIAAQSYPVACSSAAGKSLEPVS
jgi:hypothetical protein